MIHLILTNYIELGVWGLGFVAAALIGIGFANLFPLVYAIAIEALPEKANEVSGLMVTAICGGAIIPPVMGYMSERTSLIVALVVPAACLLYLTGIALAERNLHASQL